MKYKEKIRQWKMKNPTVRNFEGRKKIAQLKPRIKGKFVKTDRTQADIYDSHSNPSNGILFWPPFITLFFLH